MEIPLPGRKFHDLEYNVRYGHLEKRLNTTLQDYL